MGILHRDEGYLDLELCQSILVLKDRVDDKVAF